MPPKATETTRVTKTTQDHEGDAPVRKINTETTQRRGGAVVKKVESDLTTKTESAATRKARIARAALPRPEARPLTKAFFQTLLATLEADRHRPPGDPR